MNESANALQGNLAWLPDKRFYEYAYHKYFTPEVEYKTWKPWDKWDYPERDITRFEQIIKNQTEHIQNKSVLDIGCHLGYISLFCLHNGAVSVTGTNVRERELDISSEICNLAGYNNFNFVYSDIYDIGEFKSLCNRHDTVIISGVMYHVNNHYSILQALADSSAKCVIIESQLDGVDTHADIPYMRWKYENATESVNGLYRNTPRTFVGVPNHKWFEQALLDLNFKIVYNNNIEYVKSTGMPTRRCIITATKD
jgi:SAM-dependent methyltransferase